MLFGEKFESNFGHLALILYTVVNMVIDSWKSPSTSTVWRECTQAGGYVRGECLSWLFKPRSENYKYPCAISFLSIQFPLIRRVWRLNSGTGKQHVLNRQEKPQCWWHLRSGGWNSCYLGNIPMCLLSGAFLSHPSQTAQTWSLP